MARITKNETAFMTNIFNVFFRNLDKHRMVRQQLLFSRGIIKIDHGQSASEKNGPL
jgi:hypothetical protein